MKRFFPLACCGLFFLLVISACSSYRMGTDKLPFEKIYIDPIRSDAYVAQVQGLITEQVMQALLRDAHVKLTTKEEADAILSMTVSKFERNVTATQQTDTAHARAYDLTLTASLTLTNAHTGKTYFADRNVTASVSAFTDGGFQPAEYQSMPTLTRRLAEQIRTEVLSPWENPRK